MISTATLDPSGTYRYRLRREWGPGPAVGFILCNPSTADHTVDDPTIRRCIGFARAWGYEALEVVNLFALRATDPIWLYSASDPVGPDNDAAILACRREVKMMVAGWGEPGKIHPPGRDMPRGREVRAMLREEAGTLHALWLNASGAPRHPLYLRADLEPFEL